MQAACAPPHRTIPTSVDALTVALTVATVAVTVPQYIKLLRSRSSAGLSLPTVVLTAGLNLCDVAAAIITKWRQLQDCAHGAACVPELLDLVQTVVLTATSAAVLVMVVCYPPHDGAAARSVAAITLFATAVAWAVSAGVSLAAPCSRGALSLAQAYGVAAAGCAVVQYIPQLRTTLLERSSGSLSVSFYLLQAAGGLIVAAEQVFAAADPWPVWLPFLCSTSMQLVVALCCVYFDCVARQRRAGDSAVPGAERLLDPTRSAGARDSQPAEVAPAGKLHAESPRVRQGRVGDTVT